MRILVGHEWKLVPIMLLLGSCAGSGPLIRSSVQENALPESVELVETPFFPQEKYQCGPAALATLLTDAGVEVSPNDLVAKVYIPERRGSLQVEMLAATSSHGRLPYVIRPELGSLMAEVAAGRPVLVLQNLGLKFAPVWHYAVVTGYDAGTEEFFLRSGITERRVMSASKFARAWRHGDNWAMIALRPGELPAVPAEKNYFRAAAALEGADRVDEAAAAYTAAAQYWPESFTAFFGLANAHYAAGELAKAEATYRLSLQRDPGNVVALNNLAHVLLEQNRCAEALQTIDRALAEPEQPSRLQVDLTDSRATIIARCRDTASADRGES